MRNMEVARRTIDIWGLNHRWRWGHWGYCHVVDGSVAVGRGLAWSRSEQKPRWDIIQVLDQSTAGEIESREGPNHRNIKTCRCGRDGRQDG